MKCKNCGNFLNNNMQICPNCGQMIEKKDSKKIIIIILFCLLLSTGIVLLVSNIVRKDDKNTTEKIDLNDKNNKENNSDNEYTFDLYDTNMPRESKDDKDISKNIEIFDIFFNPKATTAKTQSTYIYGKNNNNIPVKVNISIEYYDAEGYRIDADSTSKIVNPNSEFVINLYVKDDSIKYKSTKLIYYSKKVESYYTLIDLDDLEISSTLLNDNFDDKNIEVFIKNNSNIKFKSAYIGCIYYKDGKKVFANTGYISNINPSETGSAKIYSYILNLKPYDKSQRIEFDDYKVFLYSAFDYDTENYQ